MSKKLRKANEMVLSRQKFNLVANNKMNLLPKCQHTYRAIYCFSVVVVMWKLLVIKNKNSILLRKDNEFITCVSLNAFMS